MPNASLSVDVSFDGTAVPGLTVTGQYLGSNSITALQLGDTSTGRTDTIDFDDVAVSTSLAKRKPGKTIPPPSDQARGGI